MLGRDRDEAIYEQIQQALADRSILMTIEKDDMEGGSDQKIPRHTLHVTHYGLSAKSAIK